MLKPNQIKNCFNEYFFIYKDAQGYWNEATNPVFIAEHTCCRAVKYEDVTNVKDYLNKLNKYVK